MSHYMKRYLVTLSVTKVAVPVTKLAGKIVKYAPYCIIFLRLILL